MGRMYGSPDEFLRERLSDIIGGKTTLGCLFATYNEVRDYPSGVVNTGKPGLSILVQSGNLQYSDASRRLLVLGIEYERDPVGAVFGVAGIDMQSAEARAAQAEVVQRLRDVPTMLGSGAALAVIYAGLSAFEESLAFAQALRKDVPGVHVVVVTCACDENRKARTLMRAIAGGAIEDAVFTERCGGDNTMRDILETLVAAWPNGPQA